MNKTEMARRLSELVDSLGSRAAAERVLDALFDPTEGIIAEELAARREVLLPGFGTFTTREHPAREGRNPRTGAPLTIAARRSPHVRFGQPMKDRIFS